LSMADWLFVSPQHARLIFGRDVDDDLVREHAEFLQEITRRITRPDGAETSGE